MNKTKNSWWVFEISLVLVILLIHVYIAFAPEASVLNWYSNDDAFYYFKVAQNIAAGGGVTFDGINITNGFHPLWMLVCIPVFWLAQFDRIVPLRIMIIIAGLLNAGTGIFLFRFLKRVSSSFVSAFVAVLWTCSWSIHTSIVQNGLESNVSAFFIAWLLFSVATIREEKTVLRRQIAVGVIASLTVLARLDNIFLVMLVGVWFILDFCTPYLRTVIVSDFGIIFCVGLLSYFIRLGAGPLYIANSASLPWLVALNFIFTPIFMCFFGLYKPSGEPISLNYLGRTLLAVSISSSISGILLLILQKVPVFVALPRLVIIINWALLLSSIFLSRVLNKWLWAGKGQSSVKEITLPMFLKNNWKRIFLRTFSYFAPLVVLLGVYLAWSQFVVGTLIPVSGQVKHWWGDLPNTVYGEPIQGGFALFGFSNRGGWALLVSVFENIRSVFELSNELAIWGVYTVYGIIITAIIFLIIKNRQALQSTLDRLALSAWFWGIYAHILYYTSTSYVHMRPWYWSAEMLFSMVLLALLLESLWMVCFPSRRKQWRGIAFLTLSGLLTMSIFVRRIGQVFPYQVNDQEHEYFTDARYLESLTEPGSLIGMTGSGANGYFIDGRTIVNLDGLISSPEYFYSLQAGEGSAFLDRMGVDYVYGSITMLTTSDPYRQLLEGHLELLDVQAENALYKYLPTP